MRLTIRVLKLSLGLAIALRIESDVSQQRMRDAQQDNIRESAYRYLFRNNDSGLQQTARVFCISIQERDPSPSFLARFRNERIPVIPLNACSWRGLGGVSVRSSGEEGLWFDMTAGIYWTNSFEVYVDGSYYEAPLSAAGYTWRLIRRGNSWVVVFERMKWIS